MKQLCFGLMICALIVAPTFGADKVAVKNADALNAQAQRLEHKAKQRGTSPEEAKKLFEEASSLREQARQVRAGISANDAAARAQRMAGNRVNQQARQAQLLQQQLERQQLLNQFGSINPNVVTVGLNPYQLPIQTVNGIFYPRPVGIGGINGVTQSVYTIRRNVNSFKNLANTFRSFRW